MNEQEIADKYIMEDEHVAQHFSTDWANLQDRCYECYKMVQSMQRCRETSQGLKEVETKNSMGSNYPTGVDMRQVLE